MNHEEKRTKCNAFPASVRKTRELEKYQRVGLTTRSLWRNKEKIVKSLHYEGGIERMNEHSSLSAKKKRDRRNPFPIRSGDGFVGREHFSPKKEDWRKWTKTWAGLKLILQRTESDALSKCIYCRCNSLRSTRAGFSSFFLIKERSWWYETERGENCKLIEKLWARKEISLQDAMRKSRGKRHQMKGGKRRMWGRDGRGRRKSIQRHISLESGSFSPHDSSSCNLRSRPLRLTAISEREKISLL